MFPFVPLGKGDHRGSWVTIISTPCRKKRGLPLEKKGDKKS